MSNRNQILQAVFILSFDQFDDVARTLPKHDIGVCGTQALFPQCLAGFMTLFLGQDFYSGFCVGSCCLFPVSTSWTILGD